jgi:hypothetical protein
VIKLTRLDSKINLMASPVCATGQILFWSGTKVNRG